jgi:hypothetical protein
VSAARRVIAAVASATLTRLTRFHPSANADQDTSNLGLRPVIYCGVNYQRTVEVVLGEVKPEVISRKNRQPAIVSRRRDREMTCLNTSTGTLLRATLVLLAVGVFDMPNQCNVSFANPVSIAE